MLSLAHKLARYSITHPESLRKLIQHLLGSMGAPSSHGEIGDRQQREATPEEGKGSKEGKGRYFPHFR